MERFGKVALNIWNLNPEVAMHHMVTALRPDIFSDSLCKKLVLDMDELRQRATKFMQLEELKEFRHQVRSEETKTGRTSDVGQVKPVPSKSRDILRIPKFTHYTPLNVNRARILEEALNAEIIVPRMISSLPNADQGALPISSQLWAYDRRVLDTKRQDWRDDARRPPTVICLKEPYIRSRNRPRNKIEGSKGKCHMLNQRRGGGHWLAIDEPSYKFGAQGVEWVNRVLR